MSPTNPIFLCLLYTLQIMNSQHCLTSPPSLTWTASPTSPTALRTTLTFDVSTKIWNNGAISFTTRLFNDLLPAPTMRIQRGKQYEILLINNLGPERAENADLTGNQERDPNTTNLHTHGLHISPLSPADQVFARVDPGANITYLYSIPCAHSGGVHWYHPHHHPSVQLHVAGGAAGVIIVEDDAVEEGLPDWYMDMRELVFFINHIDSRFIRSGYPKRTAAQVANQKVLQLTPRFNDVYIVNGEYQPTICQTAGEWIKFRFAQTEVRDPQKYQIGNEGECSLKLLARDGVIVGHPPRDIANIVWLSEASRADVAITCSAGTHAITVLRTDGNIIIAYIHVEDAINSTNTAPTLTAFEPIRPHYLRDLRNYTVDNSLKMKIRFDGIVINDGAHLDFDASSPYFDGVNELSINSINEWRLVPDDFGIHHPFHIHVNHFQIVSGPQNLETVPSFQSQYEAPSGWQQIGDYLDTIWGASTIRFSPDIWAGPLVIHCHRLEHEVGGAMGAVFVYNGCDSGYNDYNEAGSCNVDPNECLTSNPTHIPTITPSVIPTMEPTLEPTDIPTLEPIATSTAHPTVEPTNIPTSGPIAAPTAQPTNIPTLEPTVEPTHLPSYIPTIHPTYAPTVNPSEIPSSDPTILPTYGPTIVPTYDPTILPTYEPTILPTYGPSVSPTAQPTNIPTHGPTNDPTLNPTYYPTISPSVTPTTAPTYIVSDAFTTIITTEEAISASTHNPTINFAEETRYNVITTEYIEESAVFILKETEFVQDTEARAVLRSGLIYGIMGIALMSMAVIVTCVVYHHSDEKNDLETKNRKNTADTGSHINSSTFNVTISTTHSPSTGPVFETLNNSMDAINEEDPSLLIAMAPNAFKQWEKDYDCKSSETSISPDRENKTSTTWRQDTENEAATTWRRVSTQEM